MKKSLLATAVLGALVAAAGAQATTVKLSGQVNRMIFVPDDAAGDEISFVDNAASGSRFRVTGAHDMENGLEAGFRLEYQLQANGGSGANGARTNAVNSGSFDPRYADIYFKGNFGKISLGKGDDASDGITEADLSGTFLSGAGSTATTDTTGGLSFGGATAGGVYSMTDGFGRTNRLRYDTPTFAGGLAFAASIGQGSSYAVKGTYNGNVGIGDLAVAVGYADSQDLNTDVNDNTSINDREILGASASLLFNFGVSITAAYSDVDADDQNGNDITRSGDTLAENNFNGTTKETSYVKLGYKFGVHALAIDYGVEERDGGEDGNVYGIGYVATPVSGVELYAGYRVTETDDDSYEEDSVNALLIGSRVKF